MWFSVVAMVNRVDSVEEEKEQSINDDAELVIPQLTEDATKCTYSLIPRPLCVGPCSMKFTKAWE